MPTSTQVRRVLLQLEEEGADTVEASLEAIKVKADELAADHPELKPRIDAASVSAQARVVRQELNDILKPDIPVEVTAEDEQALATVDDLKLKLDELKARSADIKFKGDDKELQLTMDRLQLRMDELKAKIVDPEFELKGAARAQVEFAALDLEMDKLKAKADESGSGGFLSKFLGGGEGGGGLSSLLEKIPLLGGQLSKVSGDLGSLSSEGEEAGEALGSLAVDAPVAAVAVAALGAAVGAALAEADMLVTGLAAAGLGIASFAALAYPTFSKIIGAVGDTKAQLAKLPAPIRDAVNGVKDLEDKFKSMAQAFQPEALKVFNGALKIANDLLPYVSQFADAAAPAVNSLMSALGKDVKSQGFKDFMDHLKSITPGAITAIGKGLLGLAGAASKLFTIFSEKDVVTGINVAFGVLKGTISAVVGTIEFFRQAWDRLTGVYSKVKSSTSGFANAFKKDWAEIRQAAQPVIRQIETDLGHLTSWWNAHWTQIHAVLEAVWLSIRVTVVTVMAVVTAIVRTGVSIIGGAWQTGWDLVKDAVKTAWDLISGIIRAAVAEVEGVVKVASDLLSGHWSQAWRDMETYTGRALQAIVQTIERVTGDFGTLLYDAGRNVVQGLINGIESMIGGVGGAISSIAGEIRAHLPFSPAKKGPLSGAGSPDLAGRKIAEMVAGGMTAGVPGVSAASARIAAGVGTALRGAGLAASGAGAVPKLQIEWTGSGGSNQQFISWLQKQLRIRGANVAVVGGSV